MNYLYLGDCLNVLQDYVKDESVDLVYIDPPFNSKRNYNVFFHDKEIQVQRLAFEDTWSLKNVNDSMQQLDTLQNEHLYHLLRAYQDIAPQVFPYLVMMTLRILELHRVLKPTGSFYLHCDPTASHYLKTGCDAVFGVRNFRNEITWKRTPFNGSSKSRAKQLPRNHDVILFYSKREDNIWNPPSTSYSEEYLKRFKWHDERGYYRKTLLKTYSQETFERLKEAGRLIEPTKKGARYSYKQYLEDSKGITLVDDIWSDINMINPVAKERLGYPTQKPKTLLERIIQASSNEGDLVLDAFCGCGTTVDVAEGLRRRWLGIDISPFAISLIKHRLQGTYQGDLARFEIRGIPTDENSAVKLWEQNAFAFQDWWIMEFGAFSTMFGKKGADKGIDGIAVYAISKADKLNAAFQVKGGQKVQSKDIDALLGAMVKHKCELGVFLTRAEPTRPMLETIAKQGYHKVGNHHYPKLQILTLQEFFAGQQLKLPKENVTFKSAEVIGKGGEQAELKV